MEHDKPNVCSAAASVYLSHQYFGISPKPSSNSLYVFHDAFAIVIKSSIDSFNSSSSPSSSWLARQADRTQGASDDESCDNRRSPRPFPSSSAAFSAFVFFRRRRPRRLSMGARYPIMPGKAEVAKRCKGGTEAEDGFHELQRWRRDNDYLLLDASSRVF
ncbi:hypothetical protein B296_00027982 [Ensete ventricosum]|uniref:Uncharacterized protein n=1 Tax=Ensete ventricosum TaxID=4639 RepID=A0A426ZB57_ENSVE|nr:hypothetical protein B296_00027982 [Ensete ventricosum]